MAYTKEEVEEAFRSFITDDTGSLFHDSNRCGIVNKNTRIRLFYSPCLHFIVFPDGTAVTYQNNAPHYSGYSIPYNADDIGVPINSNEYTQLEGIVRFCLEQLHMIDT